MAGLFPLPTEFLLEVLGAGPSDKKLRLVCKQFNFALEPRILTTIALSSRCLPSQVESLAITHPKPTSRASKYATQLKIRGLYPAASENKVVSSVEEAKIRTFLLPAIESLSGVRKVVWDLCESDPEWANRLVVDGLASLPFLEDLHLHILSSPDPPLQLCPFPNLTKLTCSFESGDDCHSQTTLPIARLIGWSQPKLTTLIIDNHNCGYNITTLHSFLAETPRSLGLNITHLSLSGLLVRMDVTTIRHLRSLISLTVERILLSRARTQNDGADFFLLADDIWSGLRSEKIHLSEIVTDDVTLALIEYLTSFSGLRRLKLPHASPYHITTWASDEFAVQFYERALQNHVNSLESLEVNSGCEGKWSFEQYCSGIIKKCVRLASLKLSINSQDIPRWEEGKVNDDAGDLSTSRENAVWSLLDICTTLPVLKTLTLLSADPVDSRWGHGIPASMHRGWMNRRIADSLEKYGPITSSHVFRVSTVWEEFEVRRDELGTNLRYRPIARVEE